jgi:CHRD domain
MRRYSLIVPVLFALASGCANSVAPTTFNRPTVLTFTAPLSPASEVPPVTGAESTGSGTATITFNVTRDAGGSIISGTVTFAVNLTGFPAGTTLTGAHIHPGALGINGGIVVNSGLANGEVVLNGPTSFTKTGVTIAADLAQTILNSPGAYYFNVHSTNNTGGVARGQLALTSQQ